MSWVCGINADVMQIIAPNAPRKYPKLIPKRLVKRLGAFDPERWTDVLSKHRIDLIINDCDCTVPVIAEFDEKRDYILLQITNSLHPNLVFHVIQTIMHEMIHVGQSNREVDDYHKCVDKGKDEFDDYLSLKGEIEAYSHCLFLEVMDGNNLLDCPTFKTYSSTSEKVQKLLQNYFRRWSRTYKKLLTY